jgi:hypothetical protein
MEETETLSEKSRAIQDERHLLKSKRVVASDKIYLPGENPATEYPIEASSRYKVIAS